LKRNNQNIFSFITYKKYEVLIIQYNQIIWNVHYLCERNNYFCFSCVYTEVARTRLREEGTKYRSFFQTLLTVYGEEGPRGLYRGLTTQLVRQIPNTAIMMATYEAAVYVMTTYYSPNEAVFYEDTDDRYE
jgi:hypothetical protein